MNVGRSATLAGLTACEVLGLKGFSTATIHILVSHSDRGVRAPDGVVLHVSRRFCVEDRHPARRPPTVGIERGLIDGAAWTRQPRHAAAIILAGIQQRLTLPARLRTELEAAGSIRHAALLRSVIADAGGGVHALSELDFARLCRRYRLPPPERQVRRRDASGRIRYLDVRMRCTDGGILNVEIDGAAHLDVLNAWDDMSRDVDLLLEGDVTVRIPSVAIRTEPARVAALLHRLLGAPWRDRGVGHPISS